MFSYKLLSQFLILPFRCQKLDTSDHFLQGVTGEVQLEDSGYRS